jgi:hypothetical protein
MKLISSYSGIKQMKNSPLIYGIVIWGSLPRIRNSIKDIMIGVYSGGGWNLPVGYCKYITEETSPWYGYESWSPELRFRNGLEHYQDRNFTALFMA